jgi:hypothetical protein
MKNVKQIVRSRSIIAWLSLAVFVMPYVVKPVHVHHHCDGEEECADSSRHCDDCPICHFTLSCFTEAETCAACFVPPFPVCEKTVYEERLLFFAVSIRHLRGPPEA